MRRASVLVVCVTGYACTEPPPTELPASEPPPFIEAISATELTGTVGAPVDLVPTVRAADPARNPLPGVVVRFYSNIANDRIENYSAITDSLGLASVGSWTLSTASGVHYLTATATGAPEVVRFMALAQPGPPAQIVMIAGDAQFARPGTSLAAPLVVRVTDAFGNEVAGAAVTFTVLEGGGLIDGSSVLTNSIGIATSGPWTMGSESKWQRVRAAAGGAEAVFRAIAHDWPPFLVEVDGSIALIDGDDKVVLTAGSQPAWSPDGRRIAFARRTGSPGPTST
jgi:hypothetical protein